MAKPAAAPDAPQAPAAGPTVASLIMAMVVLTGLSVGVGGMFGLQVLSKIGRQPPASKTDTKGGEAVKGRFSDKATLHALSPIVTNLASPERTWIRLEASIVIDGEGVEAKGLAASITEDTIAYLRTLSLPLIEGASGLLHLREELNDRTRIRSGGKVRDLIIHTLIVE
ncbi:MAG: flagellar basal body-associated FliL family protein [Hyphomonadaceae bacterium]|jgi:flagellar FliL protein|nr:flagellar basal body-associated FliL family protein [Hyphomonadaceae bacterium]